MSLVKNLSELKTLLFLDSSSASSDRNKYFAWELNFLVNFLALRRCFAFGGDQHFLDNLTQEMLEIWRTFYATLPGEDADMKAHFLKILGRSKYKNQHTMPTQIWATKLKFRAKYFFSKISSIVPLLPSNKDDNDVDVPSTPKIVMDFLGAVAQNLNVLLQINDPSSLLYVPQPKEQIEDVMKELKLLRLFVIFVSEKCIEPQCQQTFFSYVVFEAFHAATVSWLYLPAKTNLLLSDLLQKKMKPIQPGIHKFYIDVLQALKSTIQSGCYPDIQNENAADNMESPGHNMVELSTKEDITLEDVSRTPSVDFPSNIQPIKAMIYIIIRKEFQSNLPRYHGLGYVDLLLGNLKEFQCRYSDSLAPIEKQLQIVQKEFESLQPFLKPVAEEQRHKALQDCATQFISKAYEVEYVVDACISKEAPHWCLQRWLLDITQEITGIRAKEIQKKQVVKVDLVLHDVVDTSTIHTPSQLARNRSMTEEMVGFGDVMEELKKGLFNQNKELDVISIAGMPGLGKTTLAYKLYSDRSVISHFEIRAQCCVSQVYNRMDLLLELLHYANGESSSFSREADYAIGEKSSFSTEADAADKLRRVLLPKRYLILVDDVWETSAWDDLKCCFYDANNGSRIILTTRHLEVANYAKSLSKPIPLRLFNDDESWKLLEDKVCGKERCPPQLEEVGQQIAKKCGGLPLSIVLVAGVLAKEEKKEENWKQVAITLGSHIHKDSKAIIEHSYRDLPCHLKPCFLYFGAFLEDRVIDASTLTRLWISEAFIKHCKGKSLEDIAEVYLENLIGRNLVMVSRRSKLDGKVKACRIHDALLEFCKKKAPEENFLLWIKRHQNVTPNSHNQHAHRWAFCEVDILEEWRPSFSLVGSILSRIDTTTSQVVPVQGILQNFKFLKVLDLEHYVTIDTFPTNMVHLRYFSARMEDHVSISSSISNLWNLETLIFNRTRHLSVPMTIWTMVKLRYLHISDYGFTIENAKELLEDLKLDDLHTLSTPYFTCIEDAESMLRKTPNIRELSCKFEGVCSSHFPVLDFPKQLETLQIFSQLPKAMRRYPVCISAPTLKKLKLVSFKLGLQHLSNIAQLQNLRTLKLQFVEFEDNEKWEVSIGEFPQLKVLKLFFCSLKEWTVSDDAFPNLEFLFLRYCKYLEKIPSCFEDISSLKSIRVVCCNEAVVNSAKVIQETQVEDYQNTEFQLFIKE